MYLLTKDEGGSTAPLTDGKQVLLYSQTWDCATFVTLPGDLLLEISYCHNNSFTIVYKEYRISQIKTSIDL